jgi:hypothetical protein
VDGRSQTIISSRHQNILRTSMTMNAFVTSLLVLAVLPSYNQAFAPFSSLSLFEITPDATGLRNVPARPQSILSWNRKPRVVVYGDSLLNDGLRDDVTNREKRRWPRKLWSQIARRNSRVRSSPAPLRMLSVDDETEALLESITKHHNDDFILRNFEEKSPDTILPVVGHPTIDSEFYDVTVTRSSSIVKPAPLTKERKTTTPRSIGMARLIGRLLENILTGIIVRNTAESPESLKIHALPRGNAVPRLVRGTIYTDVKIEADRLVFPAIRMSSGSLEIKRMALNVMGFLPNQRKASSSRYPKQFDLHADDLTFSRHDLLFSPCIRNGLQRLLVRILRDRGVKSSSIKVSSIDILVSTLSAKSQNPTPITQEPPTDTLCSVFSIQSSGKVSVIGEAKTLFDSPLSFEVRTGFSTASRGHVLTFPGLEVALNRDLGLFVPVVPVIDLDIGHNARLRKVDVDGKLKHLRLSASVTITPASTVRLNDYVQATEAFAARFSYDVGQWLTQLGNFTR